MTRATVEFINKEHEIVFFHRNALYYKAIYLFDKIYERQT